VFRSAGFADRTSIFEVNDGGAVAAVCLQLC
jgi:hypothetical protein